MGKGISGIAASLAIAAAAAGVAGTAHAQLGTIRIDNWFYYQDNPDDSARFQYRPRIFIPYSFGDGWTFTQRVDLPFYYTNTTGPANADGSWTFRNSDFYVEEIFDTPDLAKNFRMRGSLRLVAPTGGSSPFGARQWQAAPAIGGNWRFPDAGVTFAPLARYSYGFNEDPGITAKRSWTFFPELTFKVDDKWSVGLWPEQGITYNVRNGKWFVPLEGMAYYRYDKQWEFSFGGAFKVVDDDPSYRWLAQGRIRYFWDRK